MTGIVFSFLIIIASLIVGLSPEGEPCTDVLFEDDFSYPDGKLPDIYWAEGSQRVEIADSRLYVDATPREGHEKDVQCTVWLNKVFSGDVRITFDAHVVSAPGHENNINFFLFYRNTVNAPLYENRKERWDGRYKRYHDLNGYIFTYVANGSPDKARFRLRDNPGFNLLSEYEGFECRASRTYHIEIIKKHNRLQYLVNRSVYLDAVDDKFSSPHNSGFIGFRTWRTALWFDNLKVSRL